MSPVKKISNKKDISSKPKLKRAKKILEKSTVSPTLVHTNLTEQATEAKRPYIYSIGKRKTSIATIRLFKNGQGEIMVNKKDYKNYFPSLKHQEMIVAPLMLCGKTDTVDLSIKVVGGGMTGQVDSIRHGIAKGLLKLNTDFKKQLKSVGLLTRDARIKERKKYGLKGARRAPQWQKR